ncbi:MAG: M15 family metallopeptidase [Balneola sp.]|nr:M15 family metallopeptidase [Balneola sp.]MBO6652030.1 M15 family metallopeptidase [Balneola sp.]MBO6711054.1 M15 family metallopeptidase [Balneola sp.]MBO6800832.1 M15 family metallopeptidase [Balneola sp.]MBO6868989.1 M15 family metallopeptidase [Balneola sp.]
MKIKVFKSVLICSSLILLVSCSESKKEPVWNEIYTKQGLKIVEADSANIKVHLRYSTNDNFLGKDVYGNLEDAYLQPEALSKLYKASEFLSKAHPELKLLIWDSARPRRIQQVLWDKADIPLPERSQYVANPESGSIHNYGCAIDLTLADSSGNPLDMGTDYDDFSETAHIDNEEELISKGVLTDLQVRNRAILRTVMTEAGFIPIRSEWWHFDAFSRAETKDRFKIVE